MLPPQRRQRPEGLEASKVFLGVAFDLGRSALPCLDIIPEIAELIGERRLVNSGRILLTFKKGPHLQSPSGTIRSLSQIEDDRVRAEQRCGVPIPALQAGRLALSQRKVRGLH